MTSGPSDDADEGDQSEQKQSPYLEEEQTGILRWNHLLNFNTESTPKVVWARLNRDTC